MEIVDIKRRLRHLNQNPDLEGRLDAQMICSEKGVAFRNDGVEEMFEAEQEHDVVQIRKRMGIQYQ